jgi:hypothetical protein
VWWLDAYKRKGFRKNTVECASATVKTMIAEWGDIKLADLEPEHIIEWRDRLAAEGYEPSTLSRTHGRMKQIFDYAVSACELHGFEAIIVGRVEPDGTVSRRVLLCTMLDDDVVSRPDVYQEEGYMTAQLDADSARRVGQALIDAADEIDRLSAQ